MRDSCIFYRSFFEAISSIPDENKLEIYHAIFSYSLDFIEPELNGLSKSIFTLIKPQLDANNKRFENGTKPKTKQPISKIEAKHKQVKSKKKANNNVNVNKNDNKNINDNVNLIDDSASAQTHNLQNYIKENFENVSKIKKQLTFEQCELLCKDYDRRRIAEMLQQMDNKPNLKGKYVSVYLTLLNWLKNDFGKNANAAKNEKSIEARIEVAQEAFKLMNDL